MEFEDMRVVVTGAGRDTGLLLAEAFAARGARVYLSARDQGVASRAADVINQRGGRAEAFRCDLADRRSVREFGDAVNAATDRIDVLVNNAAQYREGEISDDEVEQIIAGGATGTVLLTQHLLPLLRRSERPDIVNMISGCGEPGNHRSAAHPAFYAAKHAQAGFAGILSHRLRPEGIRVISLFPPDFEQEGPRTPGSALTARSVVDCVMFAVGQPRDCFIREFRFEQVR
ncbi:oxidoreductase [Actinoplanes lobatus]|uniref:NAD(P)-dependent dehydrogenase (Short-subunit alcohol dehydrogenase family) n=1 Tax=Actinoplanes lobatus TaxID=113568 RepID=A0A7W7MKC2_9ACTN|nr:SDR family oxidoreductase [Actinoplanes lobatus]MBB4753378.1 NAD(P)-dependent dehydrogenase (short-subunit alcohol dehydrogenase family) [Actinoplanes lobatus]GGN59885.1 oxidoreductase [Actinoplanes lobatus]GIE37913.1 oxidoreductase [Actinoplanes lobatus]